jgi:hypothetical protein
MPNLALTYIVKIFIVEYPAESLAGELKWVLNRPVSDDRGSGSNTHGIFACPSMLYEVGVEYSAFPTRGRRSPLFLEKAAN